QGDLIMNGGASLNGTDVTIVLTSSTGTNYPTVRINGGAVVNITAPTTGPFAGVAIFQDRNAPAGNHNVFNGGSTLDITGAIYMAKADLTFTGGNAINGSCTQIVANTIQFTGSSRLRRDCPGSGV